MPPKTNVYNLIVKSSFESSEHMPKKEQRPYFECWLHRRRNRGGGGQGGGGGGGQAPQ